MTKPQMTRDDSAKFGRRLFAVCLVILIPLAIWAVYTLLVASGV